MAEFSVRRLSPARRAVLIAAAIVVVGGAVGGGVTMALAGNSHGDAPSSSGGGSTATAAVVRTTLVNTVQEGGALGYGGSYTVTAPSGASAAQVSQQEQLVAQDKQALSGDELAVSDAAASGDEGISAAQTTIGINQSTLAADQATEAKDCAGSGGSADAFAATPLPTTTSSSTSSSATSSATPAPTTSASATSAPTPTTSDPSPTESGSAPAPSPTGSSGATSGSGASACSQDQQKVTQDEDQLAQARQQLASAETMGKTSSDQAQAKAAADQVKLQGDETTLSQLRQTAVNPGTAYTWLPKPGAVIKQDQPVYQVSGEPVPLLYGAIPAYRAFYVGMSDGGDVGELIHDLITLGFGDGLTQSNHYSSATAATVARWQQELGLPATGQILLGEVVFEPSPIRVTSVTPTAGASVGGGGGGGGGGGASAAGGGSTVLTATGTAPAVTVDLVVTQEYLVKPGDAVSVVLPNGASTVGGHVESVGSVATCSGGGSTGTGGSSNSGGNGSSPCSSSGSNGSAGSNSTPTVAVTITLDSTPPSASLDQAPVNVNITSQSADNVLAVPVNALLALSGGGYGVDVVSGGTAHLVGITTGLYSSTMVQVSGSDIAAGERVEVPSS